MLSLAKFFAHIPDLKHQIWFNKQNESHEPEPIVGREHHDFNIGIDVDKIFDLIADEAADNGKDGFSAILEIVKEYTHEDSDNLDISEHLLNEIMQLKLDDEQIDHLKSVDQKIETALRILQVFPDLEDKIDDKIL